jgi:prolyl oligopeptidase PreP (S9A serine peptidase family)
VADYLKDAHAQVKFFGLSGDLKDELELPGIGTVGGFGGKRGDTETFYAFTGYNMPTTVYRYDCTTGASTVFRKPDVDVDPDDFVTKQIFYTSKDGTRVPMFITHKRGLKLDGQNPTLLYGYGGFNIPLTPYFSVSNLVWMEMGGVYAVANIRGGGEYGREWHRAGMRKNRQNVFDDFIAAAEMADRQRLHRARETGHPRWQQRRAAGRGLHGAATRSVRGGVAGGRRAGHAPLQQVYDRLGVGVGLRFAAGSGRVQGAPRLLAAAQLDAG